MATCPRCGTTLKDEYGMSQCPNCGAFSFIDMDGVAVIQAEESVEVQPPAGGAAAPPDFGDPIENIVDANSRDVSSPLSSANESQFENAGTASFGDAESGSGSGDFKPFDPFEQMPSMEAAPTAESPQEFAAESAGGFGGEASTGDSGTSSDFGGDFESIDMSPVSEPPSEPTNTGVGTTSGFNAGPKPMKGEPSFGPANDPLNLNDFANSELSAAKDGPLLFRVLISGIDTREIRDSIREVLQDPRFAWDSNEIFSKVSKGHLAINGLSPVKASILITRIKRLPVQIRWEQYAIAQGQP